MILPVCINDTLGPMPTHLLKKLVQLRGCMKVKQLKRESVKPSESENFLWKLKLGGLISLLEHFGIFFLRLHSMIWKLRLLLSCCLVALARCITDSFLKVQHCKYLPLSCDSAPEVECPATWKIHMRTECHSRFAWNLRTVLIACSQREQPKLATHAGIAVKKKSSSPAPVLQSSVDLWSSNSRRGNRSPLDFPETPADLLGIGVRTLTFKDKTEKFDIMCYCVRKQIQRYSIV